MPSSMLNSNRVPQNVNQRWSGAQGGLMLQKRGLPPKSKGHEAKLSIADLMSLQR